MIQILVKIKVTFVEFLKITAAQVLRDKKIPTVDVTEKLKR